MLLNINLFEANAIIDELQTPPPKGRSTPNVATILTEPKKSPPPPFQILQRKLQKLYFPLCCDEHNKTINVEQIQTILASPISPYNEFPRLKFVLEQVFRGNANIEIPEDLHDWQPTLAFKDINEKYGYFEEDLSPLFQQLAIACRKMTSLIEHQAYDDEMAYKLMALLVV